MRGQANTFNPAAVALTGGTIANVTTSGLTGASNVLGVSGISIGVAPTGTMGNNGAVTLGTALDRTYSEGLWLFYPAGAVAAGTPASATALWTVMSSSTVGTVFNSTFSGTGVPTPGTATAFVTTGPGAFTGDTSERGFTVAVAAGLMGLQGILNAEVLTRFPNTAGNKTTRIRHSGSGGSNVFSNTATTTTHLWVKAVVANMGIAAAQAIYTQLMTSGATPLPTSVNSTVDTSVATTLFYSVQIGTATDWQIISFSRTTLEKSV